MLFLKLSSTAYTEGLYPPEGTLSLFCGSLFLPPAFEAAAYPGLPLCPAPDLDTPREAFKTDVGGPKLDKVAESSFLLLVTVLFSGTPPLLI